MWRSLIASDPLVYDVLLFNTLAFMHASHTTQAIAPDGDTSSVQYAMTVHRSRAIEQIHTRIDSGDFNDVLLQCVMSMLLADVSSATRESLSWSQTLIVLSLLFEIIAASKLTPEELSLSFVFKAASGGLDLLIRSSLWLTSFKS